MGFVFYDFSNSTTIFVIVGGAGPRRIESGAYHCFPRIVSRSLSGSDIGRMP